LVHELAGKPFVGASIGYFSFMFLLTGRALTVVHELAGKPFVGASIGYFSFMFLLTGRALTKF
jgi:hypothetical protein